MAADCRNSFSCPYGDLALAVLMRALAFYYGGLIFTE